MLHTSKLFSQQDVVVPEFVLVEYPGIINNLERALDTLGGLTTINQAYVNNRQLEFRPTPENPYTSGLSSERSIESKITSGTMHLVMTVRRKKKDPTTIEANCLGLVSHLYSFNTMCDFQYLPVKGKMGNHGVHEDLIPQLIPLTLRDALCWWQKPDTSSSTTPLFLPPFQFSRYNTPSQKILCRETDFSIEKTRRKTGHGQNLRVERKALSITVHANDPFPAEPPAEAIADANNRCKRDEPHRRLAELFAERPLWTRVACVFKTGLEDNLLKALLQKFAFYISSGPWGRLWCRFGYDPRLDPEAKKYQTLVVSFRQHARIPERQRLKVATERKVLPSTGEEHEPIDYAYTPGRLPRVRQMWYCLCDIEIAEAQELIEKRPTPDVVTDTHGWMNAESMDQIRKLVKEDVEKTTNVLDYTIEDAPQMDEDEWV
ncbi:unnamed protein product, partial [Mesorhabditis belari]|uniref:General transcription factor 3C polypeptide 5 n=1 Tax=Mesorhabditis belari TaxID=2138241 RepID=A0AAF3EN89_9BILA